jgi:hypothetical protein
MRTVRLVLGFLAALWAFGWGTTTAQMAARGGSRSLGGYGASTISSYYSSAGGGTYIPYLGGQGGFIPYRGLEPRPAATRPRPLPGTPIGGASAMTRPGHMSRQETRLYSPFLHPVGLNPGGGMLPMPDPTSLRSRQGIPRLGYPFWQPPSLSGSGGSMGPSM